MLLDLSWSEILLVGTVALIFIGPKDLPKAMRVAGYWVRKARTLSREFQSSIDQMIREAELDEMRQDLKKAAEFDLNKEFHNTIDPTGSLQESLKPPELPNFSTAVPSAMAAAAEINVAEGTAIGAARPAERVSAIGTGVDGASAAPPPVPMPDPAPAIPAETAAATDERMVNAAAPPKPEPETHGFTPPGP
jgi:sec-independent protein translocase protein TatB